MTAFPVESASGPGRAAAPMLSQEQWRQLEAARAGAKKIRRATSLATFDAVAVGAFATLTFVCGLFTLCGVLMGLAMAAIAVIEFRGGDRLRRLEPGAARLLGFNQLVLAAVLIAYASFGLYGAVTGEGAYAAFKASEPEAVAMLGAIEDLTKRIGVAVYGTLIAVAVFAQGGTALYYFSREKHVRTHLAQTPVWIVQMQRAGVSL